MGEKGMMALVMMDLWISYHFTVRKRVMARVQWVHGGL